MAIVGKDDNDSSKLYTKTNLTEKMIESYLRAHLDLKLNLIGFKKMMDNVARLYRYFLRWPATKNKFKDEIDFIEY